MTRSIQMILAFFVLAFSVNAQSVYLKYDSDCLERFDYMADGDATPYVAYVADIGNGQLVHFDIGKEPVKWVRDLPGKVVYCDALTIDAGLVQKINTGMTKLYVVRESPTHYNISEVDKAVFINNYPEGLDVNMHDADFTLRKNSLISNRDLSRTSSKKVVHLDGTMKYQCATGYIFMKKDDFRGDSYKEYIIVPEIGIVSKGVAASRGVISNVLKLHTVNNQPFQEKLNQVCDAMQASYYDGPDNTPEAYETSVTEITPASRAQGSSATPGGTPESYGAIDPCAPSTVGGLHVVQKGETLYGISRRFGVSIDQIKAWNSIGADNLINVCQKLYVKSPATVNVSAPGGTPTQPAAPSAPAGTTAAKDGYWMNTASMHTVRPAESVAGLAGLYGYTEARFRKMNSLGPNERIYAGQKLYTTDCICPTLESTTVNKPLPYEAETAVLTSKGNPDVYFRPIKVHTVKKEETLFSIARQYDTTVDRLLELNGLKKGTALNTNQRLYVQ